MAVHSAVIDLAARQGGYICRRQLEKLGYSRSGVQRRLVNRDLERLEQGVYRVFLQDTLDARLWPPVLGLTGAVVSHFAAAELHGLEGFEAERPEVTVHASSAHRFTGATVHRVRDLEKRHITTIRGLPVTTLGRTAFDLAAYLQRYRLAAVVEDLISSQRLKVRDLEAVLAEVGRRGKEGTESLRHALAERGSGGLAEATALERLGLDVLTRGGLPAPSLQYQPSGMGIRFDAAYPEHLLAIEWDSVRWHSKRERFESDRRRDRSAAVQGWLVLRFTWSDLRESPDAVCAEISTILRRRQPA